MGLTLINGQFTPLVDVHDRAFQYGDGCFETIEVLNSRALFLAQHMQRLCDGLKILQIPFSDLPLLLTEIGSMIQNIKHAVLKIIISRGAGGRGYQYPTVVNTSRILSLHAFPDLSEIKKQGVQCMTCTYQLSENKTLAGIKHLNRIDQILARSEIHPPYYEGIVCNQHQQVIEGSMSNIFLIKNNQLITPKITTSGINGIIRQILIKYAKKHFDVQIRTVTLADLSLADELFLCNSILHILPIIQFENRSYRQGKMTQHLMQWLETACLIND